MEIIRYTEEQGRERFAAFVRDVEADTDIDSVVKEVIDNVTFGGDRALLDYTRKFDRVSLRPEEIKVDEVEFIEALAVVTKEFKDAFKEAKENIANFYRAQKPADHEAQGGAGKSLSVRYHPVDSVGIYIPGGTAPLVSTLLMTVVPAQVAGVPQIVIATPPNIERRVNPYILSAAYFLGVKNVYKAGGAQAIAAMARGTETVPKVDKIVGPGNAYVASAKRQVYGSVGIDMVAGPSEIAILADDSADPAFIAADIISQAEHDEMARSVLVTTSYELAQKVKRELITQVRWVSRREIAEESLRKNTVIVIVDTLDRGADAVNLLAPEHLEILVKKEKDVLKKIRHAGTVLVGEYSPVAVADFIAGPSHVLPTGGSARAFSGLSVDDFMKKVNVVKYSKQALKGAERNLLKFAEIEGLDGHGRSVSIRFRKRSTS
ncbi:MAG TPA: histidinol dehydrogenase [bacterium]|nr:histidinol dehydrogenase [bacterium]